MRASDLIRIPELGPVQKRSVALAALALFAENVFYTAVLPLLPEYGARFDLSKTGVGVIVAAYAVGVIASSIPAPALGRRLGFRVLAGCGLCLLGSMTAVFGLASEIAVLDLARFLQGVGGGFVWIGALGWIASQAPPNRRGAVMGVALSLAVTGAVLGPVVGGIAAATSTVAVFGLLGVAQVALGLITIRARAFADEAIAEPRTAKPAQAAAIRWAIVFLVLPSLLAGAYEVLMPLRLDQLGAGVGLITAVFVTSALAEAIIAPLAGRVSDRVGRLAPLRLALVVAPVLCVILTADLGLGVLTAVAVAAWVAIASAWAPGMALVGDLSEGDIRGASRNWALVNVAISVGVAAGSTLGSAVASGLGQAVPFLIIGAGCVVTLVRLARMSSPPDPLGGRVGTEPWARR
jgi:MFS family permease